MLPEVKEKYLSDRTERIRCVFTAKYCILKAVYGLKKEDDPRTLRTFISYYDRLVCSLVASAYAFTAELQEIAQRIDRERREISRAAIPDVDEFKYDERI